MDYQFILTEYSFPLYLCRVYAEQNTLIDCVAACPDKYGAIGKNDYPE